MKTPSCFFWKSRYVALVLSVTGYEPDKPAPVIGVHPNCCYPA